MANHLVLSHHKDGQEIKTNTMIIRQTPLMKKKAPVLFLTLAMTLIWTSSFADNPLTSSKGLTSILNSMIQGDIDFPKRFNTQAKTPLANPDITLFVRNAYINTLLTAYMKQPIVLGHDTGNAPSTLQADKVTVKPDPQRNVLRVNITGGVLNLTQAYAGMEGKLVITSAEFEVYPQVKKNAKNQVMAEAMVRLVQLDIDQTAPVIDKGIANLLQDLYFNNQAIDALNLSDYIKNLEGPEHIDLQINQAAILMKETGITIQTTWIVK